MVKLINSNDEQLPLAGETECRVRRAFLIAGGIIKPAGKVDIIVKKDGSQVLSTRRSSKEWRSKLIEQGIIEPDFEYKPVSVRTGNLCREEGTYDPQPIRSDEEYERRRDNYLWMISDLLRVRRELKLVLGKKDDEDPDWYF